MHFPVEAPRNLGDEAGGDNVVVVDERNIRRGGIFDEVLPDMGEWPFPVVPQGHHFNGAAGFPQLGGEDPQQPQQFRLTPPEGGDRGSSTPDRSLLFTSPERAAEILFVC